MADIHAKCDFCNEEAVVDGKTKLGPWAYMCRRHFATYGIDMPGMYTQLNSDAAPTKVCRICGKSLPLTKYYKYMDRNGVMRYRNECIECNLSTRQRK